MLDAGGNVTECSNSNVWFVLDGKLVTPRAGNLDGLTRRSLIELLESAGIEASLRPVPHEELREASECFVTSATREVMPVNRLQLLDGEILEFPAGGGELTRSAMRLYTGMIDQFVSTNADRAWF